MKVPDKYNTIFALEFTDPDLSGMEVKLRRSYGLIDAGADLLTGLDIDAIKAGQGRPQDMAKLRQVVDDFSGALASWNLEDDDGQPLGTDVHTVRGQDITFVLVLVDTFLRALEELEEQAQTRQIDEVNLPMAALS